MRKKLHSMTFMVLAPSDFYLFELMKDGHGQHFPSKDAIIAAVKQWAPFADAHFYERGMQTLVHFWLKCIAKGGGDYVEKSCFCSGECTLI